MRDSETMLADLRQLAVPPRSSQERGGEGKRDFQESSLLQGRKLGACINRNIRRVKRLKGSTPIMDVVFGGGVLRVDVGEKD